MDDYSKRLIAPIIREFLADLGKGMDIHRLAECTQLGTATLYRGLLVGMKTTPPIFFRVGKHGRYTYYLNLDTTRRSYLEGTK